MLHILSKGNDMENYDKSIEDKIRDLIKANKYPAYLTTNKKEISIRCPYCGDSIKSKLSAHLYIQLTPPFKFYCHKCNTSGILNNQTMRDLGVFENELSVELQKTNQRLKSGLNFKQNIKIEIPKLPIVDSESSKNSVNYFNSRFNFNYGNKYIVEKFKAITDAEAFFTLNRIKVKPGIGYDFKNSIGFLSSDGSHVVFRDISGNQRKRYFNLNLSPEKDEIANKIYNIKSGIDVLTEQITIVITEGIFDIIGVYEHFYKGTPEEKNTIFAAACGRGFNAVIGTYIRLGFLDLKVIIYSDSDVPITSLKYLKESSIFTKNIAEEIYYNKLEKDFGVPKGKIELQKARI